MQESALLADPNQAFIARVQVLQAEAREASSLQQPPIMAELNQPRTRYQKFKMWIWNSYKTWNFLPLKTLEFLNEIFIGPLVILSFLAIMLLGGFIGITAGIAFGVIGKIFGIGFTNTFLVTLAAFLLIAFIVWLLPIFVYAVFYSTIHCIINFVFGGIGAILGLLTSFGLFFMDPHAYWERREAQEILEYIEHEPTTFVRIVDAVADPVATIIKEVSPDGIKEMNFSDFNPNIPIITDIETGEKKPLVDQDQEVIKASDGNYYLQTEFEEAIDRKIPKMATITYDRAKGVVRPKCLKEKFVEGQTQCTISGEVLLRKDAVRTVYGQYYDRAILAEWVNAHGTDPSTVRPLSMRFTSEVDQIITSPHKPHGSDEDVTATMSASTTS